MVGELGRICCNFNCNKPLKALNVISVSPLYASGRPKDTTITTNVSYNAAALGEQVAVECSANGFPEPVCQLYREGNLININGSVFVVQNFTAADQGEYTCNCSNVAGVDEAQVTLSLYG